MKFIKDIIRFLRVLALRGVASAGRRELYGAAVNCPAYGVVGETASEGGFEPAAGVGCEGAAGRGFETFGVGSGVAGPVLIVAPHPDDEILGCGGLIARLVRLGNAPEVVILSGGGGSHRGCCSLDEDTLIAQRRRLTLKAAEAVGLPGGRIHFLDFSDGSISSEDAENFGRLKEIFNCVRPAAVFVPHGGEGWPDHLAARRMGLELASELASGLASGLAGTPAACRTGKSVEMLAGTPAAGHAGKPADELAGTPADASAVGLGGRAAVTVYEYCVWMWYYNVRHLDWRNALTLKMTREEHRSKLAAMDIYTKALAPCGKPWSGVLPPVFLCANSWSRELFFRVNCGEKPGHFRESREEKTELQRDAL